MPSLGNTYRAIATGKIRKFGKIVVVERKGNGAGTTPTRQTLRAIAIATKPDGNSLLDEGDVNAENAQPYQFLFEGTADVKETVDRVAYLGWWYKVVSCVPSAEITGVVISWIAQAVRDTEVK